MQLQLSFIDLPCELIGQSAMGGRSSNLDKFQDYFTINKTGSTLAVKQTVSYWNEKRPSLGEILFQKHTITLNLNDYAPLGIDEVLISTASHLTLQGIKVPRLSIQANPAGVNINRSQFQELDLRGSACSFTLSNVAVANSVNIDIQSASVNWKPAPHELTLELKQVSGSATYCGKRLDALRTYSWGSGSPRVMVNCVGGSVNLG
ncbi:hypothetical protein F4555_001254 [Mobiluncus mulieris]|uniref:DUF4097 domain-containing protein n=1 Tax=Mobiluncus mulieris TaxID=2052 RepID=A0A378PF89_9ACTO|nr:DUF4097 family beta strand repeat-containing protein [Mobiluncus mulieris]MBB5846458.1 hypothetical protein [Mobiluncus mulieris]MCV0012367.1 hypothetical protein [Mobiluncus mulieris]STO17064.1 Uncharacterised protein [Mobiluncus mulieris]STY85146.1 Uncharacterised protein [Mobiluncus mulieris]